MKAPPPGGGSGSFLNQWRVQLANESDDVVRVAADALAFYFLFPSQRTVGKAAKLGALRNVEDWRPSLTIPAAELAMIEAAFAQGIGGAGTSYQTGRPWEVIFYLSFARGVLAGQADPFEPEQCKRLADEVRGELKRR